MAIPKITLRSQFNYDMDKVSQETGLYCPPEDTKTQQNQKEEADINTIVKRFGITGNLPQNVRAPQYGDFTHVTDYQTALEAVRLANEAFMEFPAEVRARFENDPAQFVDFCSDPNNQAEAEKLGLTFKAAAPETATPAPVPGEASPAVNAGA